MPGKAFDAHPLAIAETWQADGRRIAIATVIESWSASPRPVGSQLVIAAGGHSHGSVSGGCVEDAVIAEAEESIASGKAKVVEFGVTDETAQNIGLFCGGRIRILIGVPAPDDVCRLNQARTARKAAVTVTQLETGETTLFQEGDAIESGMAQAVETALRTGKAGIVEIGGQPAFVNVHLPPPRIAVIGAGRIARALAGMAGIAGFDLTVIDPRGGFVQPVDFAGAALVAEHPDEAFRRMPLDAYTALAAVTHDPAIDDVALVRALDAGCFYVGALGGKKSHAKRMERLAAQGVDEAAIARIHGPIGLDIHAANPPEIAVSILADIILSLRTRDTGGRRVDE